MKAAGERPFGHTAPFQPHSPTSREAAKSDDAARIRIMRKEERDGKFATLESIPAGDFSVDFVREQFVDFGLDHRLELLVYEVTHDQLNLTINRLLDWVVVSLSKFADFLGDEFP